MRLAWLCARSEKDISIPGFRTVKQVQGNFGAMQFGPLESARIQEIEALLKR